MIDKDKIFEWVVYKITSPSDRIYIGISTNFKRRKNSYKTLHCKDQKALYSSFLSHGYENHTIEVIESFCECIEYANSRERYWICFHMSNKYRFPLGNGLNLTDGGEGRVGSKMSEENKERLRESHKSGLRKTNKGFKHTEETKRNLSLARIGKPNINSIGRVVSAETRLRISNSNKGQVSANKGKKIWSEEQKKRIGDFHKGNNYRKDKKDTPENIALRILRNSKPIVQYDLIGNIINEYPSKKVACIETGIGSHVMGDMLSGIKRKSHSIYVFKYRDKILFKNFIFKRRVFKQENIKYKAA